MFDGLFEVLADGVRDGVVPKPVTGESVADFQLRCAHAGAIIAIRWANDQASAAQLAAAQAETDRLNTAAEGRHGDATVTPLAATPAEQDAHPEGDRDAG